MTSHFHQQRIDAVLHALTAHRAATVLDMGCGEGPALLRLARQPDIRRIVGLDVSGAALDALRDQIAVLPMPERQKVELRFGSMLDARATFGTYEAAILIETLEHIDPGRLSSLEQALFREVRPRLAIITTPNSDFNPLLGVPARRMRHPDHRFEWNRTRFRSWSGGVAQRNGYQVTCSDIAGNHPLLGGASQMALFQLCA